jgi:nucleoside-diphosphate-sugar epimerase
MDDSECSCRVHDNPAVVQVNLKGLWNVLECAQQQELRRVVHIGSCHHQWPGSPHLAGKAAPRR